MRMANPSGFAALQKKAPLVGAFFMLVCWASQALAFCPAPSRVQWVAVRHVVDGDTVRLVDGRSVRLIGINAPEIGRKGQADEPFAQAARKRLQALIKASDGRVGLIRGKEGKDRYGRTLAHLYSREGRNLEAQLLSEGLGYRIAFAPDIELNRCQQNAESVARQAAVGVWKRSPVVAAHAVRKPGFALVSGRVTAIERSRTGVRLTLDGAMTLHIPARLRRALPTGFFDNLKGQKVEARGWIRSVSRKASYASGQRRWQLTLTDVSMLDRVQR
ncbi:thermonuclease family protein [Pseudomonas putida]|uniref:thermonuclease family protein n=1 Tax=Pseudomonas putida TaxID=303 RepID=UPI0018E6BB11|nr:thermonuclease family protein [Pseudomonas putida]MBI6923215.1 thermonuclease family protein [Pseudomonas putida]